MPRTTMKRILYFFVICYLFYITNNVYAASDRELDKKVERATNYLEKIMETPDTSIPNYLLKRCYGVVIIRQYKVGLFFGIKGGVGVALKKDHKTNKWSGPTFVTSGEGSVGLQMGGQAIDAILLIMNKDGLNALLKAKFKLGVDASIAAGPVGRDTDAKIGIDTAFLVYSRAKGLYIGVSFEGGAISQNNNANEEYYGKKVSVEEIFKNKVNLPDSAKELIRTLEKHSNENEL